jgi:Na+/melibiose symporter and related transporters
MPLVNILGKGNQQRGFLFTTIILSIIGFSIYMIILKNCKERYLEVSNETHEKINIISTYKDALKNGPWVATLAFSLAMFIKNGATIAITVYYCIQVLKNPAMISILLPLLYVTMLIASIFAPAYLKRLKHRKGNIIALVIYIIGFCILPFCTGNQGLFIPVYFITIIFNGFGSTSVLGMTADAVDYNEWKFGKRTEGTLYAGYSFSLKVGMAIGGAIVGYILAFSGYDAKNVTDSAVNAISMIYYGVPIVLSILQIIAVSCYKLDKLHPQVISELNMRREKN